VLSEKPQEIRKEIRTIVTDQPKGKMQVLIGEKHLDVSTVKDVSPTGIRLAVDADIKIGQNILVRYIIGKVDLKLNGTVVWNSGALESSEENAEAKLYLIGIRLASPSLLQTFW
jgi:hypothetical protein